MTSASVTLLLVGIVTLNIVWGYPWTGMFSACAAMLLMGWFINRVMRPSLKIDFSLPNSAPAEQSFHLTTHARNRRRLPSMEVTVSFVDPSARPRSWRWWRATQTNSYEVSQDRRPIASLRPSEVVNLNGTLRYLKRGVQSLPDVLVTSSFPFHLFRSSKTYASQTEIAITPRPLTGEEDSIAQGLLNTLGGWSHRLLSGDALDYTGSREYEVGMPVRRWDFPSWARLGKPIVREFQSPSIRMVLLVVDTASEPTDDRGGSISKEQLLERLLSLAATAVNELSRKNVQVRLYVTGESTSHDTVAAPTHCRSDSETLLIRLAAAEPVEASQSDTQICEVLEQIGRSPVLVISTRSEPGFASAMQGNASMLRVDGPDRGLPQPSLPPAARQEREKGHEREQVDQRDTIRKSDSGHPSDSQASNPASGLHALTQVGQPATETSDRIR
ncbi:MAG: DUF58 domain-containing protein [Rubripirellula sp.]